MTRRIMQKGRTWGDRRAPLVPLGAKMGSVQPVRYLLLVDVSESLGVTPWTIRQWSLRGAFPGLRRWPDDRLVVADKDLERWLEQRKAAAVEPRAAIARRRRNALGRFDGGAP